MNAGFVSVHSPDHLRNTFEAMTTWSWFARCLVALHAEGVSVCTALVGVAGLCFAVSLGYL